jgi:hypothetical protein
MTVKELIEALQGYNENREVMIIDGFNGKGVPRTTSMLTTLPTVSVASVSRFSSSASAVTDAMPVSECGVCARACHSCNHPSQLPS